MKHVRDSDVATWRQNSHIGFRPAGCNIAEESEGSGRDGTFWTMTIRVSYICLCLLTRTA